MYKNDYVGISITLVVLPKIKGSVALEISAHIFAMYSIFSVFKVHFLLNLNKVICMHFMGQKTLV